MVAVLTPISDSIVMFIFIDLEPWKVWTMEVARGATLVMESTSVYPSFHNGFVPIWFWLRHLEHDVWVSVRFRERSTYCDGICDCWFLPSVYNV